MGWLPCLPAAGCLAAFGVAGGLGRWALRAQKGWALPLCSWGMFKGNIPLSFCRAAEPAPASSPPNGPSSFLPPHLQLLLSGQTLSPPCSGLLLPQHQRQSSRHSTGFVPPSSPCTQMILERKARTWHQKQQLQRENLPPGTSEARPQSEAQQGEARPLSASSSPLLSGAEAPGTAPPWRGPEARRPRPRPPRSSAAHAAVHCMCLCWWRGLGWSWWEKVFFTGDDKHLSEIL